MLFAAFEIAIFLALATLLGGAAGWLLARSRKVGVARAMDRSGANAAADRELEIARAEIVRLNSKLRVATDAIRELEQAAAPPNGEVHDLDAIPDVPAAPPELVESDPADAIEIVSNGTDTTTEVTAENEAEVELIASPVPEGGALDPDDGGHAADPEDDVAVAETTGEGDEMAGDAKEAGSSGGGKRLSSRVAEVASAARLERPAPTIRFDDPSD
jgi:hypothetical protein